MSPAASVFLPSYNKPQYVTEAIGSVLAQDMPDFELRILENSTDDGATRAAIAPLLGDPRIRYEEIEFTPAERQEVYITSLLLNSSYPKAEGEYIFYLSDDDLLDPGCLRRAVECLEQDPARMVCWFTLMQRAWNGATGGWRDSGSIDASHHAGLGTAFAVVDCRIDGGQVAYRRQCLDQIPQPWFPEDPHPGVAAHSDGLFLQKLADRWMFYGIPHPGVTHRRTPVSIWTQSH